MRLIDSDKLKADLIDLSPFEGIHNVEIDLDEALEILNGQPAADVQEVKHGKWIKTGWQRTRTKEFEYKCSACPKGKVAGRTWKKKTQKLPRFCEKCGAMMDLK